jgi:hypothetical protein
MTSPFSLSAYAATLWRHSSPPSGMSAGGCVGSATVDRVINEPGNVSEQTRKKVVDIENEACMSSR